MYGMVLLHFQFQSCLDHEYHEGSCLVSCHTMQCHGMSYFFQLIENFKHSWLIFAKAESESPRNEAITFPLCTLPINTGNA